jgi:hypothetical protein
MAAHKRLAIGHLLESFVCVHGQLQLAHLARKALLVPGLGSIRNGAQSIPYRDTTRDLLGRPSWSTVRTWAVGEA